MWTRRIYTIPTPEPTLFEKIRIPLSNFILYTSIPYLTLNYYQTVWEVECLKQEERQENERFMREKLTLAEKTAQRDGIVAESDRNHEKRKSWFAWW
jgi:hypothetical protein